MLKKVLKRFRRQVRIRAKISGTSIRPRLAIFRSNTSIYAQVIDDVTGTTIASASDMKNSDGGTKTERATKVGTQVAELALAKWIKTVVFDRGWFGYHGRVKALADSAREAWLQF